MTVATAETQLKNVNVVSTRVPLWVLRAVRREASTRGVTLSKMACMALEERYSGSEEAAP